MLIDLHTALECVETYYTEDTKQTVTLGCMCGTQLFKHIFDLSLGYFTFSDILLIEGCQDFIGLSEPSPANNHFYYASLLTKKAVRSLFNDFSNPFSMRILNNGNPVNEYRYNMDIKFINRFKLVLVCDAHLIPQNYISELQKHVSGKLVMFVDPFTVNGQPYADVPTVTYATAECDSLTALARDVYGVDTNYVKQGPKMLDVLNIAAPKTAGKFMNCQYVTNDTVYYELMKDKLEAMGIKKGYKVLVDDNQVMKYTMDPLDRNELSREEVVVNHHSLMDIVTGKGISNLHTEITCRLNNFKKVFHPHVDFKSTFKNPFTTDNSILKVIPGNLLTIEQASYHKFDKIIFIQSAYHRLTKQEMYTLMNITEHLTVLEE